MRREEKKEAWRNILQITCLYFDTQAYNEPNKNYKIWLLAHIHICMCGCSRDRDPQSLRKDFKMHNA